MSVRTIIRSRGGVPIGRSQPSTELGSVVKTGQTGPHGRPIVRFQDGTTRELGPTGETGEIGPNGRPLVWVRNGTTREVLFRGDEPNMGPPTQTPYERRTGGVQPPLISVMIVDQMGVACPTCGAGPRVWCHSREGKRAYSNGRPSFCPERKTEAIRLSLAEQHELPR